MCTTVAHFEERNKEEEDLSVMERSGLLQANAVVVVDNVLAPGAPLLLWRVLVPSPSLTCRGASSESGE